MLDVLKNTLLVWLGWVYESNGPLSVFSWTDTADESKQHKLASRLIHKMKEKSHVFFFVLLAMTCLMAVPSMSTTVHAAKQKTFEEWLEQYGAWDRLEKQYANSTQNESPDSFLKRAEVYLNLNSPKKALEIVEMTPSFDDNATEAQRLWLGGRAQRAIGDLSKSVLWFTQAAEHFTKERTMKKQFKTEPGLDAIWMDVWLKMYWSYSANHTLSRSTQADTLNKILEIGQTVWDNSYWEKAYLVMHPEELEAEEKQEVKPRVDDAGNPLPPFITENDTSQMVKALASISLEKFETAKGAVSSISQGPVRFFWISLVDFIKTGRLPVDISPLIDGNYLKASAFWQGNLLAPYSASRSMWLLGNPESGPWTKFRNNLLAMPVDEATKAIDNELGSMLISEKTATLLNSFKLALALSSGAFDTAATTWNKVNKQNLPLALQLAGALAFKEDFNNVLPSTPAQSLTIYPIFAALSGAAGLKTNSALEAPFWITASQGRLKKLSQRTYPMDKLLLLAYWQQEFDTEPTVRMAKRSAYLFNDTFFGTDALLYLATDAVKAKKLQLGAFYLNQIAGQNLDPKRRMTWLDIKTRLELDSGRNEAALNTFKKMAKSDVDIPVMTRLRMALLFQQRRDFDAARRQLLAMWENRASMTTTLQAETLFWLGEGEQAQRNTEKALDYYLRLAWQYPQENIWALTAMYRASIIYEKRGKYDTAKRLLTTVVRRADRKEQREAAKARMAAIDNKMGKRKNTDEKSTLVYPF